MADDISLLVRNYFSKSQFRDVAAHVITADEDAANAFRVADGRRIASNRWAPPTVNTDHWVSWDAGVGNTLTWDRIALDRGHNLGGKTVLEQRSTDAAAWVTLYTYVIPATAASGGDLDATNGITTKEGAWHARHATQTYRAGRLFIGQVASFAPVVPGVWMGPQVDAGHKVLRPTEDEQRMLVQQEEMNEIGWSAGGPATTPHIGEVELRFSSSAAFDTAAESLVDHYMKGRPMWFTLDADKTEETFLAKLPAGSVLSFPYPENRTERIVRLPFREYQPKTPTS